MFNPENITDNVNINKNNYEIKFNALLRLNQSINTQNNQSINTQNNY